MGICYLQLKESDLFLLLVDHGLWQHSFNHFVNIIVGFEQIVSDQAVVVNLPRLVKSILHLLRHPLITKVQSAFELLLHFLLVIGTILNHSPIEADITGSLMSQFERATSLLIRHSSKDKQCLLRLAEEG
jgi:hypothetical protein